MGLRFRFNLVLIVVFMLGLGGTGYVSYRLLDHNARDEVVHNAGLMIQMALSIRAYTVDQIRPNLALQMKRAFLPQSVPAYSATETLNGLPDQYREYFYKEATLNPTNPRDRATDWEADLVQAFRRDPKRTRIVGRRDTATGPALYIARPIQIRKKACLTCHSTAEQAPKTMVALYGDRNGFGWKLNEIVGAQIVSVPMSVPVAKAKRAFFTFMISLSVVFLVLFVALNLMLGRLIIKPIADMARVADQVSTGNFDIPEFKESGKDEVSALATSFNRMRRSLEKAMKMIDE